MAKGLTVYQQLALQGRRVPFHTRASLAHLSDSEQCMSDGGRLAEAIAGIAERDGLPSERIVPWAVVPMDLDGERKSLLHALGIAASDFQGFHEAPDERPLALVDDRQGPLNWDPRMQVLLEALRHLAQDASLTPVGMVEGPFTLMERLLPGNRESTVVALSRFFGSLTPKAMQGFDMSTLRDVPDVHLLEQTLELTTLFALASIRAQVAAGAKAILIADPTPSLDSISPTCAKGVDRFCYAFERFVIRYLRRLISLMRELRVGVIYHNCNRLDATILSCLDALRPDVLSLGSAVDLALAARCTDESVVLMGNVSSRHFQTFGGTTIEDLRSDAVAAVRALKSRHHLLAPECDIQACSMDNGFVIDRVRAFVTLNLGK